MKYLIEGGLMTIWITIAVLGIVLELFSTQLIAIWFTLASIISAVMQYNHVASKWQWIQFVITGVVLALIFHPIAKKILQTFQYKPLNTPETIVGKKGIVMKIDDQRYRVDIQGDSWLAKSDDKLVLNDPVKVTAIDGVTLTVEKIR